jgi:gliding motility-associated-like protein
MKNIMRKILLLSLFISSSFNMLFSQNLVVQNPSFEGTPAAHITPPLWGICMPGVTPDTQPGIWGVSLPPSDGSSYLGMCHEQSGSWQEGASQELLDELTGNSEPMQAGETYDFTIDVSDHPTSGGWNVAGPVELLVWGGFSVCDESELLWSSGDVPNFIWTTYNVSFTPSMSFTHIMFQCNALTLPTGYLIIDNMSSIAFPCETPQTSIVSTMDYNTYDISCNGFSDGGIDLTVSGGSLLGYTYLWNNNATTEDITNLSAGIYSVDITDLDNPSCTTSTSFTLTEPPLIILTSNLAIDTCNSGMAEVIVSGGVFPYNYLWTDNQITPVINNFTAEDYSVIITDANNCTISEQFYIDPALFVTPIAEFNVIPDLNIHHLYRQMDKPIFFIDKSVDELTVITNWLWEFEDGFISSEQDTRHSFAEIGDFNVTLAIETLYGCVDTITKRVIIEEFLLYIPNSFTPQNDGVNDVFLPKGIGVNVYELKIFSRWGEHFFTSDDINIGWNGTTNRKDKIAQTGVYVYLINVTDVFGEKHTYNGKVTLIK